MAANDAIASDLPLFEGVSVLAQHPCGLRALYKPPGVLSHPNPPEEAEDLPEAIRKVRAKQGTAPDPEEQRPALLTKPYKFDDECFEWTENGRPRRVYLLNRLDSPTTGLVLVSLNDAIAEPVRELFASHRAKKTYLAIVKGRPPSMPPLWIDLLERSRDAEGNLRVRYGAANSGGGKNAVAARTRYHYLRQDLNRLGVSLVQLMPVTGRTHQLRVQCAKRKAPIVGDQTYGDFRFNRRIARGIYAKRMFLHAAALELKFNHEGETVEFKAECPMPEDFSLLLDSHPDLWIKADAPGAAEASRSGSRSSGRSRSRSRRL
ncbi:MAG: RluA family pseudouridine synthase [Opitutales bacterium]